MERGPDGVWVDPPGDQPTKLVPVLEMEWFSETEGQVEFCYEGLTMELVEMVWAMTAEEAEDQMKAVNEARDTCYDGMEFYVDDSEDEEFEDEEFEDEDFEEDVEPHELEESVLLIVQNFVINCADDSEVKKELLRDLLKLQEQMARAFVYYTNEGTFEDEPRTVKLLGGVLPVIDEVMGSARFVDEMTSELLGQLRGGVVALIEELR